MKEILRFIRYLLLKIILLLSNFFGIICVIILYLIKPYKHFKIIPLLDLRIGELSSNTEIFLRRLQKADTNKPDIFYVGLVSNNPANAQLLKMFKRKFFILQVPIPKSPGNIMGMLFWNIFHEKTVLGKSTFYQTCALTHITTPPAQFELSAGTPTLSFTSSEEKKGRVLLKKMGVGDNSWFICFHSRDSTYLKRSYQDLNYHDYRDSDIENYLKAAEYITDCKGYAIRMGYHVEKEIPKLNNPKIIDYATHYRTDFGDIYLPAKCKFFIGNTAGIFQIPTIFNVPVAGTNWIPLEDTPFRKGDIFIPKKIWSIKKNRVLTFREILESEIGHYFHAEEYKDAGIIAIENTPEEILDLATEMNERLDGTFISTKEDEELQDKFLSLYKPNHICYGTPARIGTMFLRQNKELLE